MVYLLHFHQPIAPGRHSCQHYIGYCRSLRHRLKVHRENPDARLLQVAKERGIGFTVARTWKGGRDLERQLKQRKNAKLLCPICTGKASQKRGNPCKSLSPKTTSIAVSAVTQNIAR